MHSPKELASRPEAGVGIQTNEIIHIEDGFKSPLSTFSLVLQKWLEKMMPIFKTNCFFDPDAKVIEGDEIGEENTKELNRENLQHFLMPGVLLCTGHSHFWLETVGSSSGLRMSTDANA